MQCSPWHLSVLLENEHVLASPEVKREKVANQTVVWHNWVLERGGHKNNCQCVQSLAYSFRKQALAS